MKMLRRSAALGALAAAALLAVAPVAVAQTPAPTIYYLFVYSAGPAWKAGQPMSAQGLGPHGAYMTKLFKAGVVVAGSPSFEPQPGGLAILKAKDMAEAKALLAADPAIQAGLMTAEIRNYPLLP